MNLKVIIALIFFFITSAVSGLDYEDCGSTATVSSVTLEGCEKQPCTMVKGRNYVLKVFGRSTNAASALPYTIKAKVLGVDHTFYEGNACDSLEIGSCPHGSGVDFVYSRILTVGPSVPQLNSVATSVVKDETGRTVICAKIQVEIRNA